MAKEYNDVYGQVELDYQAYLDYERDSAQQEASEAWVFTTIANANDVIKEYGVRFFVEHLNNMSKIALSDYYRKMADKKGEPPF
ncbi:MAG: hypothetical protein RLY40_986 [Pseudomonadota bacterium]|jgi:hypothetical protein